MSTVIEVLYNAECNIRNVKISSFDCLTLAEEQLHNAILLLELGYDIYDEVEPLLEKYGDIYGVPKKPA